MKSTPGIDYTPIEVTVRVSLHKQGTTVHKGFTTNESQDIDTLMKFVRKHIEGGRDVEITHD